VNSSAIEAASTSSAMTPLRPTVAAAAPSPSTPSSSLSGAATRTSAAATSTWRASACTARSAASRALTPLRAEPAKSAVKMARGRSQAVASTLAICFSA
jgi:hypothetical protein